MQLVDGWFIPDPHPNDPRDPVKSQWNEAVGQIELATRYARERRVCIQAGARVGVWPFLLIEIGRFEQVHAFEPEKHNYECLDANVSKAMHGRIYPHKSALGAEEKVGALRYSKQSSGEHYMIETAGRHDEIVHCTSIDALDLPVVDAIFLDVEGYELEVLKGARETIKRCTPLLVCEENALCFRYGRQRGDLDRWLMANVPGYQRIDEWHTVPPELRNDGVFRGSDLIFRHE